MEKLPSIHLTSKEHIDPWEQSMSRNERKLVLDPYRWCRRSGEGRSSGQLDHTIWLRDEACGDPLLETLPSEFAAEFRVVPFNVASGGDKPWAEVEVDGSRKLEKSGSKEGGEICASTIPSRSSSPEVPRKEEPETRGLIKSFVRKLSPETIIEPVGCRS